GVSGQGFVCTPAGEQTAARVTAQTVPDGPFSQTTRIYAQNGSQWSETQNLYAYFPQVDPNSPLAATINAIGGAGRCLHFYNGKAHHMPAATPPAAQSAPQHQRIAQDTHRTADELIRAPASHPPISQA